MAEKPEFVDNLVERLKRHHDELLKFAGMLDSDVLMDMAIDMRQAAAVIGDLRQHDLSEFATIIDWPVRDDFNRRV